MCYRSGFLKRVHDLRWSSQTDSLHKLEFVRGRGCSTGRSAPVQFALFRQITRPLLTGKHTLCLRDPPFVQNLESMGGKNTRECLISGETVNKKRWKSWQQSEAGEGVWGKTAAVQNRTQSVALVGGSPLKLLQSLYLSHVQSLRGRVHRKTWKLKKAQRCKN